MSHLCNVNLRKLINAHKSHVRETSLLTGAIPNQVRNSQTFRLGARSKSGKVQPRRQRGTTVGIDDDGRRVVALEWNWDRIA